MKKSLILFIAIVALALVVAACGSSGGGSGASNTPAATSSGSTPTTSTSGGSSPTVHLGTSNFVQKSITISKGQSLTLKDDVSVVHIITNGSWVNGSPQPKQEPGAPKVNITFNGNDSHTIGPFNTAGTFHYYCTIHVNMNLTVTVQ